MLDPGGCVPIRVRPAGAGRSSVSGALVRCVLVFTVVQGLAGCEVVEPLEDRLVGILAERDGATDVAVPDTVASGVPFVVSVKTVGGACVRKDETELELSGSTATVTPYDRYAIPRPGLGCLPTATAFDHATTVTFMTSGDASVVIRGREEGTNTILEFAYAVVVIP
jgi:hypothetical protein